MKRVNLLKKSASRGLFSASLLENAECRRLLGALCVIFAAATCAAALFCFYSVRGMEAQLTQRECAVAGRLIDSHAASTDAVINAFSTRSLAKSDSQTGARALETAGYGTGTINVLAPFFSKGITGITEAALIALLAAILLSGLAIRQTLKGIYGRIERAGRQAALLGRGDYDALLCEDGEGAFARMGHAFNEMSRGVRTAFEKLADERVFLKNLISDISHQLKTPLAALKMYNEILVQEETSDAARDFIEKSAGQLDRMEWLILGLLKTARVESGCLDLSLAPNDLLTVVQEAAQDFALTAKEKGVELQIRTQEQPTVVCDAAWLKEAVGNVFKNCIEYTPPGGRVTAEILTTSVLISLKIRDTGTGISPDELPFVFRRFYRGRSSTGAGSGIGLSLAKSLAEQMGGTLTAGGEYGCGAEFTFSFVKGL